MKPYTHQRLIYLLLIGIITLCLAGCAGKCPNPDDPYEGYNRGMFQFNRDFDKTFIRPVAIGYKTITPCFVRNRVHNFLSNLDEIPTIANDILQFSFYQMLCDTWRFGFNTTIGVGGLFDVATNLGLPTHDNDFGLTLAKWGVKDSPYLVLPILGPSTPRDAIGMAVDTIPFWPLLGDRGLIGNDTLLYSLYGLRLVQKRTELLSTDELVNQAFDPYVFVRNAYLQKRKAAVNKVRGCESDDEPTDVVDFPVDDDEDGVDDKKNDKAEASPLG